MSQFFLSFHLLRFFLFLLELGIHYYDIVLECFERFGLVFRFMESRLKIIESHIAVFFSSVFALILVFTVKS